MKKIYLGILLSTLLSFAGQSAFSQINFFKDIDEAHINLVNAKRVSFPQQKRTISIPPSEIKSFLWALPNEKNPGHNRGNGSTLEIPMPDGKTASFQVWETNIMEAGLAAKFPEMKTFSGRGINDPSATLQADYNPYTGFHVQVLSDVSGNYYIDPYARGNTTDYMTYYARDNKRSTVFSCSTEDNFAPGDNPGDVVPVGNCRGTQLYTYRLALACTGEYAVAVCSPAAPSVAQTAAAMLTTINRVNGVYEKELAIRMVLVADNNNLIYLDGTTDPYANNSGSTMLGQNQANIDAVIGSANYDIGHVVSTGGGGVANLRVPCTASKARGVTGLDNPVGDNFDIDYVAHEMGHQWGGNHTFNSSTGSCNGNRNGGTAYEVGAGTTIQAYAGICGSDNTQPHSDPHFHSVSFDEISVYVEGGGAACRVVSPTGNTLPQITAMNDNGVSIPINTPFTLNATATDADGDALTYCWEEWDLGASTTWNGGAATTTSPLFKSRVPKATGSRTFPDIAVIAANYPASPAASMGGLKGETLPTVARDMKFRLTVRDNRTGGGAVVTGGDGCQSGFTGTFKISAVGSTPFAVTFPNGGETFSGLNPQTITWNVAGSDLAPVNTANVKISLSLDGGLTYPTVLLASTPNDGSESIIIPNTASTSARIKIEAIGNIFFDISNANFTILVPVPGFVLTPGTPANIVCAGPSTSTITLGTSSVLGFNTPITLSATAGVPAGTTVSFSTNPVTPGNSTDVTLNNISSLVPGSYNITITGVAGTMTKTTTLSFVVAPGTPPAITSQPMSVTRCAGNTATFDVATSGSPATGYQWQVSTDGGANFTNITGALASTYAVTNVTSSVNNYQYRVLVFGQCGTSTSSAATLMVNEPIVISGQPVAASACLPVQSSASFSVSATGTAPTYQWQVSTDGGVNFTNIAGATNATLSLPGLTVGMTGYQYRVVLGGTCTASLNSTVATLTVNTLANITGQPQNKTVCAGVSTSFNVAATGNSIAYQWQASTGGGAFSNLTNTAPYSGVNTATLTVANATAALNGTRYQVVVTTIPCGSVTSSVSTLTVNPLPLAVITAPTTVLTPYTTTVLSVNTGTNYTYQWYRDGVLLPGVTAGSIPVTVDGLGDYSVVVTDGNGCSTTSAKTNITGAASSLVFVYPNPNKGQFQVRYYNATGSGTYKVNVYDSKGSRVHSQAFPINSVYTRMNIDLRRTGSGLYLLEIRDGQNKRLASSNVLVGR